MTKADFRSFNATLEPPGEVRTRNPADTAAPIKAATAV
jgi:hypothetical protein